MRKFQTKFALLILIALIPFLIPTGLNAQPYSVNLVADVQTLIPGGIGIFDNFSDPVSLDIGESEAFQGEAGKARGIYTNIGGAPVLVADESTPIPGGTGNFSDFNQPISIGSGDIAFKGLGSSGQEGIYAFIGGTLTVVADFNTNIPGSPGNFTELNDPVSIGGGNVAFKGRGGGQQGIYACIGGTLTLVANLSTMIPGGTGNFIAYSNPVSLGGGNIVFRGFGSSGQQGIYTSIGGTIALVADKNTMIPGGTGNFSGFFDPVSSGSGDVAFIGQGAGQEGVYTSIGGTLTLVADQSTMVPGGTGNFVVFNALKSLGGGDVVFSGRDAIHSGIFKFIGGTLSIVVDLNTPIPGGTGNFTSVFDAVSLGGMDIAFRGFGSSGQQGIYTSIGGTLSIVVDLNTPIPGGTGNFTGFDDLVSLGGVDVTFKGLGAGQEGLYTSIGGTLAVVADLTTMIPGGSGNFSAFNEPVSLGGGNVAFRGFGTNQEGIYTFIGGTLAVVADLTTMIPGGTGNFTDLFKPASLGGGDVAFLGLGSSSQVGIYTSIGGTLALVADTTTMIPGGTGTFTSMLSPESLGGGDVAFIGNGSSGQSGIYTSIGGTLALVADTSTMIPGGTGTFTVFFDPVPLGGGDIVFKAQGAGQEGIYTLIGGTLAVVADLTTMIPGGTGTFTDISNAFSLGGGGIAFKAQGAGQEGIYTFIGGTLVVVADLTTMIPGGTGTFTDIFNVFSLGGGGIAFQGLGTAQGGIYKFVGGTLSVVADLNTMIPGGTGNFTSFGFEFPDSLGGEDIAFAGFGSSGQEGIYTSISGTLTLAVDRNTPIPGGTGNFDTFGKPHSLGGKDIAFLGFDLSGQKGVYNAIKGQESLTILKESDPDGATGFEFMGTGFPAVCSLDGTFTLDDDEFEACDIAPASYTVQETNSQGFTITDIDCIGASDFSETADSVTVNLTIGENVVCTFTNTLQFALDIVLAGTGSGTVTSSPGIIDCGTLCSDNFVDNTMVDLTATPDTGSSFNSWSGSTGCTGTNPDLTITVDAAKTCTATFDADPVTITVNKTGSGDGTITSMPAGINCGTTCNADFTFNSMVGLTAAPDASSDFVAWTGTGDCAGATPTISVTADAAKTCTAEFALKQFTLTASTSGASGTVTSNLGSISCGTACMDDFDINTVVQLTATPDATTQFVQWSGDCGGTNPVTNVTMDAAKSCDAEFATQQRTLTLNKAGTGTGSVTSAPAGIDCNGACGSDTGDFDINTVVTLNTTAAGGSTFTGFTGDPDCADGMVTMDSAKTCTATFDLIVFDLDINLAGSGLGNIGAFGIDCGNGGADCMETYVSGTEVTLVVTPDAGSTFTGFTGDPDCTDGMVTMNAAKTCTATFIDGILPLTLNPISPSIQGNVNVIPVSNATPGGSVAYVWGFNTGVFTVGGSVCNGIELGINPVKLLGITSAEIDGTAEFKVFLPINSVFQQSPLFIQAVDLGTCRTSPVVPNIIQNN